MEVANIGAVKGLLRREIRALMSDLTPEEKSWSDGALCDALRALPQWKQATTVFLYHGVGGEVDTRGLIQELLDRGARVCLPRCLPDGVMEARQIAALDDLAPGVKNIPAPSETAPLIPPAEIDLVLVPGLCCDREGFRLGQGGGYYDRYLEHYQGMTVCLCREDFLQSMLPREIHDKPVRLVLTEDGPLSPEEG